MYKKRQICNVKKTIAIIVVFVYTILSVVSYIGIHYCHGQIQSIAINNQLHSGCCDTDKKSCCNTCEDLSVEIDFEPDQNRVKTIQLEHVLEFELFTLFYFQSKFTFPAIDKIKSENESPPGIFYSELYLLNNSFLFYG